MFATIIQSAIKSDKVLVGAPPVGYPLHSSVLRQTKGAWYFGALLPFLTQFEKEALVREHIARVSEEHSLARTLKGYVLDLEGALREDATSFESINMFLKEVFLKLDDCSRNKIMCIGLRIDEDNPFSPVDYTTIVSLEELNYKTYHVGLSSAIDEVKRNKQNNDIKGEK